MTSVQYIAFEKYRTTKQMYVIDGSIHKVQPDSLFQVAIEKLKDRIIFETVQEQDYIKTKFEERLSRYDISIKVDGVIPKGNKHERIISLEPDVRNRHISFGNSNIFHNKQVRDYNKMLRIMMPLIACIWLYTMCRG